MQPSPKLIALIKTFEGFKARPYQDSVGVWTIGYGHTAKPLPPMVTKEMASALLVEDLSVAVDAITKLVRVPLSQNQFDALCSFTFNLGEGAFSKSTLLRKINNGQPASSEFLRWVYAGKSILPGLVKRRQAEKHLYESTT